MAVEFYIKQSDTAPAIVAILKDANLVVVNLTSATAVRFIMTNKTTGIKRVDHAATIVDAVNGKVKYQWITGDCDIVGPYNGEFEIAWSDGTFETFPNSKNINIKVVADLGGTVG